MKRGRDLSLSSEARAQLKNSKGELERERLEKRINNISENSKRSYLWVIPLGKISPGSEWHEFKSRSRKSILWLQEVLSRSRREDEIRIKLGKAE